MADEERYLYTVFPKKPIKNLNENTPLVRCSKSLFLTKEEVLKCFECGSVYRRFSNEGINEKFNKYEIDRVHRKNYISREDWKKLQDNIPTDTVAVNGVEEKEEVVTAPEVEEAPVEEVKEEEVVTSGYVAPADEEPVSLDNVETTTNVPEDAPYVVAEPVVPEIQDEGTSTQEVATTDEIIEDTVVEGADPEAVEAESEANTNIVVNMNGGKKKKHH